MAGDVDDDQKTEEPTEKRLQDAHEQGDVPLSRELNHWFMILGILIVIMSMAPAAASTLTHSFATYLTHFTDFPTDTAALRGVMIHVLLTGLKVLLLPMVLLMAMGVGGSLIQTGPILSAAQMAPKWSKLSPLAGMKRQFSMRSVTELGKNLAKLIIVGTVSYMTIHPMLQGISRTADMDIAAIASLTHHMAVSLLTGVLSVMTLIAALDLLYQRLAFLKKMRMSKQEMKDEFRQSEGDPLIKGKIRQLRIQRARRRMMAEVPKADVVITNPTHFAVAMKYDAAEHRAPVVVAKGQDTLALKIREVAKEAGVPIMENPPLARALYASVEIDQEVPPEHYKAVAEVISYVFKLKKKTVAKPAPVKVMPQNKRGRADKRRNP